ncbi:MAG: alpha/beta fold hydrolase [Alphaproteobacteria bacterium]|nr:alpha/beta fold hydrolase [Alphaproteobacteria bacterium]
MATPLVLLPGLLNDARLWRHQVEALADIADPLVPDLTQDESLGALARRVLDAAPPRFALAGLSMGGYLAFEILRQQPERVERLALLDTTARPDLPEQSERRKTLIGLARGGRFAEVPPALLPAMVAPRHQGDPARGGLFLEMAEAVGAEGFARQQTAIMNRPDSRPVLPGIAVPTVVVCGRQDSLTTPETMREIAEGIPRAAFVLIEDSGHLSPVEQPHAVSAVLRYWLQAR